MSYQQEITIASGVTSTGLIVAPEAAGVDATVVNVQPGGTLAAGTVKAGDTVSGTFGATLTDLVTETVAGASGVMLEGDTVELDLTGATAPAAGWQIATGLTDADAAFTVNSGDASKSLVLGDRIRGGDYDGYGFSFADGLLKFSKLA